MSNENQITQVSVEKLEEQITLNEDRIESTLELLEDCEPFVRSVLLERLSHYRWCLSELRKEKLRRLQAESDVSDCVIANKSNQKETNKSTIEWDIENLKGTGDEGEKCLNGVWTFTFDAAKKAAKKQGKRLPTKDEIDILLQTVQTWDSVVKARKFGDLILEAKGSIGGLPDVGLYWTATESKEAAFILYFNIRTADLSDNVSRGAFCSVRCVNENQSPLKEETNENTNKNANSCIEHTSELNLQENEYDEQGHLIKENVYNQSGVLIKVCTYTYNANNIIEKKTKDLQGYFAYNFIDKYNDNGQLTEEQIYMGDEYVGKETFIYDSHGNTIEKQIYTAANILFKTEKF